MKKQLSVLLAAAAVVCAGCVTADAEAALLGDINENGVVESGDALSVLRSSVGLGALNEQQRVLADLNYDGSVDSSDALEILRMSVFGDNSETADDKIQAMLDLVNAERENAGVAPLILDEKLCKTAGVRAKEISKKFDHLRPDGSMFNTLYNESDIDWIRCGENICAGMATEEDAMLVWMNSEGHRANILDKNFTRIGIGFVETSDSYYWVQDFSKNFGD